MPAVPPSYDQAVAGGAGGNVGGGGFYPQLPPQEKGVPPPANYGAPPPAGVPPPNAGTTTVVTQVMEIVCPCDPSLCDPPGPVCPGPELWIPASEDDLPPLPGLYHHQDRGGGECHGLDPLRRLLLLRLLALRLHPLLCGQPPGGKRILVLDVVVAP